MKRMRVGLSAVILLLVAACTSPQQGAGVPDETFLPSVGSGWNLAAKRASSATGYEAPIAGADGIYVFRAASVKEVIIKTPRGRTVEIEHGWRNLQGGLLPGWRAYSNREGLLVVFYGATSRSYSETRVLILGDAVKSVRFLSHDGSRLTDTATEY